MIKRFSTITVVLVVMAVVITGAGCLQKKDRKQDLLTWTKADENIVTDGIGQQDSEVALALLDINDVEYLDVFYDSVRPSLIEFNDHLQSEDWEDYMFFNSRSWYDRASGALIMQNAITKYRLPAVAVDQVALLAGDAEPIDLLEPVGDTAIAYFTPADDGNTARLTYRFTVGQYGAKIHVIDVSGETDMLVAETNLLAQAAELARYQYTKLSDLLYGSGQEVVMNDAMNHLPQTVSGTTPIGLTELIDDEWLGVQGDMISPEINGFVSGGLSRFRLDGRPDEVVEIVVMEFKTAAQAEAFRDELLSVGLAAEVGTPITLPPALDSVADALGQDTMLELQATLDNYLVDVAVFAPFTEMNTTAAETDLIDFANEVIENFQP